MPKFTGGSMGFAALAQAEGHAGALGLLSASWAEVEHSFVLALQFAAGVPYYKAEIILFAVANHKARQDILLALAQAIKTPEVREEYVRLISGVSKLAKRRNAYTHASWMRDMQSGEVFILNHQKMGHPDRSRHVPVQEIVKLAVDCSAKAREITQFFVQLSMDGRAVLAFAP